MLAGKSVLQAQQLKITIQSSTFVGKAGAGKTFIEPHLASDPRNAQKLVAASFIERTTSENSSSNAIAVFTSSDGGQNWKTQHIPCNDCTDPWVTITPQGMIYLITLGHPPNTTSRKGEPLLIFTSTDGGLTWSKTPQSIAGIYDGPRVIAAPDGSIYLLVASAARDHQNKSRFGIMLARANPGQPTLQVINHIFPSNLNLNSDGLALLSDGTLVITYQDFQRKTNKGFRGRKGRLKTRRSWAMVSYDKGKTFSVPLLLSEDCGARPSSLVVDQNGPFKDYLYCPSRSKNLKEVLLFTAPKDPSAPAEVWTKSRIKAQNTKGFVYSEPLIAVNSAGIVGLTWWELQNSSGNKCFQLYFTASADGGKTFAQPIKITQQPICPDYAQLGFPGRRWRTGGDYFGFTTTKDGQFHLFWPKAKQGTFGLWSTRVTVKKGR